MGGEKNQLTSANLESLGSPPHGRGKEHEEITANHQARITPAWAGKRLNSINISPQWKDHPRMGGEK